MIVALSLVSVLILGLAPVAVRFMYEMSGCNASDSSSFRQKFVLLGTAHVWGFLAVFPLVRRLRRRW